MKKIILLFLIFIISRVLNAQTFPYLNASTGNEGQYIVDSDTNIIMFHDNQIEKLDKNFNPIWVKKYNGLTFHSLLLSKTGSIYFISRISAVNYNSTNVIGKLSSDGSLNWSKQFYVSAANSNTDFYQLFLDRNNNLVASSNLWLLKLDTLGAVVFNKKMTFGGYNLNNLKILSDSAGVYRFISGFTNFEFGGILKFKYIDNMDTIIHPGLIECVQSPYYSQVVFYKSKNNSSTYYSFQKVTTFGNVSDGYISKYFNDSVVSKNYYGPTTGPLLMNGFDEDEYNNIIYTVSNYYVNNMGGYYHYTTKLNSSFTAGVGTQYFSNFYFYPPNYSQIIGKIHSLYGKKYFIDMFGSSFLANPLTLTPLDSNLNSNCKISTSFTTNVLARNNFQYPISWTYEITNDTTTYTNINPTVTAVTNFSISTDYCLLTSTQEIKKEPVYLSIQPNPANNILNIITSSIINEATVFDLIGKKIISIKYTNTIDVSSLTKGLYIINIKTDEVDISQKFIKE